MPPGPTAVADPLSGGGLEMSRYLEVNRIACDGHGLCAELLPELIRLDDWGYPMLAPGPIPPGFEAYVRRGVAACPTLALLVRDRPEPPPPGSPGSPGRRSG